MDRVNNISKQVCAKSYHTADLTKKFGNLKDRNVLISGASRGIGLAIARRAAQDGANIAILAKTTTPQPTLPGTIYTAAEELRKLGAGKVLPIKCDVRFENEVQKAIDETVAAFGGLDIVVNNASAIKLKTSQLMSMKEFDQIQSINTRGTFMLSKLSIPHQEKSNNAHILTLSPPLADLDAKWLEPACGYAISKYAMSMISCGLSAELADNKIAVNCLWPRTAIATAAVNNEIGGETMMKSSRTEEIMGDSAYEILTTKSTECTGQFFIDDEVQASIGTTNFDKYKMDKKTPEDDLFPDFFINQKTQVLSHLAEVRKEAEAKRGN